MAIEDAASPGGAQLINFRHLRWVAVAFGGLAIAIMSGSVFLLDFVHVMSGVLWTGIDVFVGFVLGPALRQTDVPARRAFATRLIPRMLFLMPSLAIITGTAGYFLAGELGYLGLPYPDRIWVLAAFTLLALLTVQGLGILLPTNLLACLELQKAAPNPDRLAKLMRVYIRHTGWQAAMQIAIIVVMAKFASGL
jgi:uncharacterized membrane protein